MSGAPKSAVEKFDPKRADDYALQSRIALAGYDACHELSACLLSACLGMRPQARILVAGAGGNGREIVTAAQAEPTWRFTAVDPSGPMLDSALAQVTEAGLSDRVTAHLGFVEDLPLAGSFDGATLIGVLHHLPGEPAKQSLLRDVAVRLKPGAPFILACNRYPYASRPLFLSAWGARWRAHGFPAEEARAKLATILNGADPPSSDQAVSILLERTGFEPPTQFFSSLFWGAWIAMRAS